MRPVDLHLSQTNSSIMRIKGMTRLPFQLARTRGDMKVHIVPDLCGELILGSDWLKICFNPATLTLDRVEILLGEDNYKQLLVVA